MSKVAVLGHGVVGSGTVELLINNKESIEKKAGQPIEVKYILDIRDFPDTPYSDKFTKNFDDILNDKEVSVVAEVMGGVDYAYKFDKACLSAGKSVVTSNKELVAEKGAELLNIARQNNCNFFFEASTGGAIPIIRPLHQCLAGNEITAVAGILNGTTNFILTKMVNEHMSFDDALSLAQKLGYAEKNPADDVEGKDACRKICILSSLAFGKHVYPEWVHCEGITALTPEDTEYADIWGGKIKLIGSVKKCEDGKILPLVRPAFVCDAVQLSHVSDVFNAIMVYGDAIDEVMFYGRGAGKMPTASAVVGDIIDAVKMTHTSVSQYWEDSNDNSFIEDYKNDCLSMYVRVQGVSSEKIDKVFGNVEYIKKDNAPDNEYAFITPVLQERDIDKKLLELDCDVLGKIRVLEL